MLYDYIEIVLVFSLVNILWAFQQQKITLLLKRFAYLQQKMIVNMQRPQFLSAERGGSFWANLHADTLTRLSSQQIWIKPLSKIGVAYL